MLGPVQVIDLPVRDDRSADDAKRTAESEAAVKASDETRAAEIRKADLGKEEVGKNVDETV